MENRTPSLCSAVCAENTIVSPRTFLILELGAGEKRPLFLACQPRQCQCVVLPLLSAPDWPQLCGFWQAKRNCPAATALQRKQMASQPPSSRRWPGPSWQRCVPPCSPLHSAWPLLHSGLRGAASPLSQSTGAFVFAVEKAGLCSPASSGQALPVGASVPGFPSASPAAAVLPTSASLRRHPAPPGLLDDTTHSCWCGDRGNRCPGRPSFSTFFVISVAFLTVLS